MEFQSRDDAVVWIIRNLLGRRNLSAYDRSILALRLKPVIAEKAKERQNLGLKSDEGGRTDVELGKIAGVGKDTIHKVEKIEREATDRTKQLVREGKLSINQGYNSTFPKRPDPVKVTKKRSGYYHVRRTKRSI